MGNQAQQLHSFQHVSQTSFFGNRPQGSGTGKPLSQSPVGSKALFSLHDFSVFPSQIESPGSRECAGSALELAVPFIARRAGTAKAAGMNKASLSRKFILCT